MSEFICSICEENFNKTINQPCLFPNCGHTFCKKCVETMITNNNDSVLYCPEDNIQCKNYTKESGLASFPVNMILMSSIDKKELTTDTYKKGQKGSKFQFFKYCRSHRKPLDIICRTDSIMICSECALFENHQNHDVIRGPDFQKYAKDQLTSVTRLFEDLQNQQFMDSYETDIENLTKKIKTKQTAIETEVKKHFDSLFTLLTEKKEKLVGEIDSIFENFGNLISSIHLECCYLNKSKSDFLEKINKIKAILNSSSQEYEPILKHFYQKPNLNDDIHDLQKELDLITNVSQESLKNKLEKVQVSGNLNNISREIASSFTIFDVFDDEKPKILQKKAFSMSYKTSYSGLSNEKDKSTKISERKNELEKVDDEEFNKKIPNQHQNESQGKIFTRLEFPKKNQKFYKNPNILKSLQSNDIHKPILIESSNDEAVQQVFAEVNENEEELQTEKDFTLFKPKPDESKKDFEGLDVNNNSSSKEDRSEIFSSQSPAKKRKFYPDESNLIESPKNIVEPVQDLNRCKKPQNADDCKSLFNDKKMDNNRKSLFFMNGTAERKTLHQKPPMTDDFSRRRTGFASVLDPYLKNQESTDRSSLGKKAQNLVLEDCESSKIGHDCQIAPLEKQTSNFKESNGLHNQGTSFLNKSQLLNNQNQSNLLRRSMIQERMNTFTGNNSIGEEVHQGSFENVTSKTNHSNRLHLPIEMKTDLYEDNTNNAPFYSIYLKPKIRIQNKPSSNSELPYSQSASQRQWGSLKTAIDSSITSKFIQIKKELNEINLSNKNISDSKIPLHIEGILANKKARALNLNNNFITEIGVDLLLKRIAKHPNIEKIYLSNNYIGENILEVLKNNLFNFKVISYFNFSGSKCLNEKVKLSAIVESWNKSNFKVDF